ncbi:MAG: GNAT family N-acetyltransferase [Acidimicrobiales bacterium]
MLNNPAGHRYEICADGQLAGHLEYRHVGDHLTMTHTEILPAFEGLGLASRLARGALDDAKAHGLKVNPQCDFVAGYIRKHPDYVDLVDHAHRGLFDDGDTS